MAGRRDILLDTAPLVAILDAADQWHERCVAVWHDLADRCLTTEAVVTEACHLVGRAGQPSLPLELVVAARIPIVTLERPGHEHAIRLMHRYHSVPMDYADATLVVVAEALGLGAVFSMDRKGFTTYRRGNRASFTLVPE